MTAAIKQIQVLEYDQGFEDGVTAKEEAIAAALDQSKKLTMALHAVVDMKKSSRKHHYWKPEKQVIGELTLASLRVGGIIDYVDDAQCREKLALAHACIDYVLTQQQASIDRKLALQDLITVSPE